MNIFGPRGGENIDLQSWLFEEDGQDFCVGAKEDYAFAGQGSFSPQEITSDDIPGWTEKDSIKWNADLNLDDCLSIDLKSKSWHDNLIGEDAKWASNVYDEYQRFMAQEKAKDAVQDCFNVNSENFMLGHDCQDSELECDLESNLFPLTPDSLIENICNDIIDETNESDNKLHFENNDYSNDLSKDEAECQQSFENDQPMDSLCYEVQNSVDSNKPDHYSNYPSQDEADCQLSFENDQRMDDLCYEVPDSVESNKPQIITVPLSEAVEPQIQVINVESFKQESPEHSKIIFCRRVTLPSPCLTPSTLALPRRSSLPLTSPPPSVPLKDIITEQGDELFRDFVEMEDEVKPEPELLRWSEVEENRKRRIPYTQAERKMRKKEQNKRAAIKYRERKKEEQEKISGSLEEEEERYRQLKEESMRLMTEKEMVKQLFLDLLKRKRAEVLALR